jgi:sulfonate transport system substrate-binding protein
MKKLAATLLTLLIIASPCAAKEKVSIALWKLPLNIPAMAALKDKSYEKNFQEVDYVQLPSGPKQIQALAAGRLDITEGLGAAATLVGAANGADLAIIGANSRAPRAFAIVANNPAIKKVSDLKGRKVAGIKGSVVYQLMSEKLAESGLTEKDVEFVPTTLTAATAALLAKRVDAALLVGTEVIRASKGGCKVIADGRGVLNGLSLIVARGSFARTRPQLIAKYMEARKGIEAEMKTDPDKFISMAAKETGLTKEEAANLASWFDFNSTITDKDIKELEKTLEYLFSKKMIKNKLNLDRLIIQ